jgi:predicted methyltransferase
MRSACAVGLLVVSVWCGGCGGGNAANAGAAAPSPAPSAAGPAAAPPVSPPLSADDIRAIVSASDRTDQDRKADSGRHPAEFLAFAGVGHGMTVADLGAGGGYTTELLARAVGSDGKVYGQNDPEWLKKFLEKVWSARLALPADHVVVRSDRAFDDPLPPEAKNLDVVVNVLTYHDTVWTGVDRARMNRAIFDALKPGGAYVIVDSSARDGDGINDVKTLHRIEQSVVENEVKNAGFTLAAKGEFLRNPADARDWSSSPREAGAKLGTEDRFVLKFTKP